jgi:hypothetical protein
MFQIAADALFQMEQELTYRRLSVALSHEWADASREMRKSLP